MTKSDNAGLSASANERSPADKKSPTTPPRRKSLTPKQMVLKKYPGAFGWRQFSVSDYTVESGTGKTLASAHFAKDAWEIASRHL